MALSTRDYYWGHNRITTQALKYTENFVKHATLNLVFVEMIFST